MEALSFVGSSISIACRNTSTNNNDHHYNNKKHGVMMIMKPNHYNNKPIVYCQSSGNSSKNKSSSGVLRSSLIEATDAAAAVMDKDLVLPQPNGSSSAGTAIMQPPTEVEVKKGDHLLVPNGNNACGSLTDESLLEMGNDNGIGIKKFLGGKTLFITGATGFLGKVLIEKIIRTVPDVHKIFVLVKAKDKEAAMERVQNEIIDGELFKCLKQQYGKSYISFMLSKIVPVLGNVCQTNLGLEESIADMVAKEVDIIVNSAANTTFDERYDIALDINTHGPSRLMNFAKQCYKLKLFVQVSTAYVNGQRQGRIMEKPFYAGESILHGTDLNVEDEIKLVLEAKQGLDDDELLTQKMKKLGLERANKFGWQDTYVFTKAMGEMTIDNMRGDLPVVTIRPSVIESTCKEPFPGWIEGNRMMDPIVLYYGKGQVTGFLADPNGVLDVVPADMVVNATIAAMAKHGAAGMPGSNVYQIASSVVNPLGFKDLVTLFYEYFNSSPCIDTKGVPVYVPRLKVFSSMEDFSTHLWKEAIDRAGLTSAPSENSRRTSEKLESICKKSIEQTKYLANLYRPYTFYGGRFDNTNTRTLMECMSKEERQQFGFDINEIDWKDYILNIHIPGLRKHVMKGRLG